MCPSLGVVAGSCNPATRRHGFVDSLRAGALLCGGLCRSGVRTKPGINMGPLEESGVARLSKEVRTGPGGRPSSQKYPCRAVVGSRLRTVVTEQPVQYRGTKFFSYFPDEAYP